MRGRIVAALALAGHSLLAGAAGAPEGAERGPERLSLEESVREALDQSKQSKQSGTLGIARCEIDRAKGRVDEARSAALPSLFAEASYQRLSGLGGLIPGFETEGVPFPEFNDLYQANLLLNWNIYQGGQVRAGRAAAAVSVDRAMVDYQHARTLVAYAARVGYATVLLRQEFLEVAKESLSLARKSLDDVRSHRNAGSKTDFDILQARVKARNSEADKVRARTAVRVATAQFLRRIGRDPGDPVVLTDSLSDMVENLAREVATSRTVGEYLRIALGARLDLQSADLAVVRLQKIARGVSTAGRRPTLGLQGAYLGSGTSGFFDNGFDFSWRAGLVLQVPIFEGFAARGRLAQAAASLVQTDLARDSLASDIELEVRSAYWRWESARDFVGSASENVGEAEEAVRQAGLRYANGLVTELVRDGARLGLARARTNYARTRFELYRAMLDLQKAAGLLELPAAGAEE